MVLEAELILAKKPRQAEPTAIDITTKKDQLIELWSYAHLHWKYVDSIINGTVDLWPNVADDDEKKKLGEFRSGKGMNLVDTAAAVFLASDAKVHRNNPNRKQTTQLAVEVSEEWGSALLNSVVRKTLEAGMSAAKKYMVKYNYVVVKQPTLQEGIEDDLPDDLKSLEDPMLVSYPHPMAVLMEPIKFPNEAIEIIRLTENQLEALSTANGGSYKAKQGEEFKERTCYEYWSKYWHALVHDGKLIFCRANGLGYLPYDHTFGPLGMVPGDMTDNRWLRFKCVGILEPAISLLIAQDQLLNAEQYYMMRAAFLKVVTMKDAPTVADQWQSGILQGLPTEFAYLIPPNLPGSITEIRAHVESLIEEVTFPKILAGFHESGVSTVGQNAMINVSATRKFKGMLEALEFLSSQTVRKAFQLVNKLDIPIDIDGIEIKPSDLKVDGKFSDSAFVTYPYLDPVLKLQADQQAIARWQAGAIPWGEMQDQLGNESPLKSRIGLIEDQIYKHPAVIEYFSNMAADRLGLKDVITEWNKNQKKINGGAQTNFRGEPVQNSTLPNKQADNTIPQPISQDTAAPATLSTQVATAMSGPNRP